MSKRFYETADFKKLNSHWEGVLKEDGFQDIEDKLEWRLRGRTQSIESVREFLTGWAKVAETRLDDVLDSGNPRLTPQHSHKAAYADAEANVTLRAVRDNEMPFEKLACWILASQRVGHLEILSTMRETFGHRNLTERKLKHILKELDSAIHKYIEEEYDS